MDQVGLEVGLRLLAHGEASCALSPQCKGRGSGLLCG